MVIDSIEKIKKDIFERIAIGYSNSLDFYKGYLCAFFMADIIKSWEEFEQLNDWIGTLDIKGGNDDDK